MPTKIEWADETWNPITGCSVVSAGCKNCYAMLLAGTRMKHHPSREGLTRKTREGHVWTGEIRFNPDWLTQPIGWKAPRRVFVCAHGDLFHEGVSDDLLMAIWATMECCPQHTMICLTKRPEIMHVFVNSIYTNPDRARVIAEMMAELPDPRKDRSDVVAAFLARVRRGEPAPHIQLGVSAEDQDAADERVAVLIATTAARMIVSYEPALGPVDWRRLETLLPVHQQQGFKLDAIAGKIVRQDGSIVCDAPGRLDCIIAGGESDKAKGKVARPSHPSWYRETRDQCAEYNDTVPDGETGCDFLFKQWGNWRPVLMKDGDSLDLNSIDPETDIWLAHNGARLDGPNPAAGAVLMRRFADKVAAGRELDGRTHDDQPLTAAV